MLNPRQEKFCVEYIQSGNATSAYRTAYGTANADTARVNASRLLASEQVQARLKELRDETASEKICSSIELQEFLSRVVRREVQEEIFLPSGELVQKKNSVKDALKAAETLARISGLFVNRQEVDISGAIPVIIRDDV